MNTDTKQIVYKARAATVFFVGIISVTYVIDLVLAVVATTIYLPLFIMWIVGEMKYKKMNLSDIGGLPAMLLLYAAVWLLFVLMLVYLVSGPPAGEFGEGVKVMS